MAEAETNLLRGDLSANAFPEDIHFSLSITGLFIDKLRALGVLDERALPKQDFEWSHVFECEIEASEKTRIWPEPSVSPNNAFRSHKIAAAHLGGRLDLMVALLALQVSPSLLVVNSRDAWLPTNVPNHVVAGARRPRQIRPPNLGLGQMVLDFYGRSDVVLVQQEPAALHRLQGVGLASVVLCLHPDSYTADVERARQVMQCVSKPQHVIVMTPFPDRLNELAGMGFGSITLAKIGHRHIPEQWHETAVAMLM